MLKIINETGIFFIDDDGVLTGFQSAESNQVKENVWHCLDIPEGVRVIPEEAFRWCHIQQRLTFPKSLRVIGAGHGCAFANSTLPHVELPDTLEKLGDFVFGASKMDSLRIPKGLKSEYARQFKESVIGTLYLPEEFRSNNPQIRFCEKYEEQYGYIRSMLINNVRSEEVIFE